MHFAYAARANIDDSFEILVIYNQGGYSQLPAKHKHLAVANGKILVRALKAIIKVLKRQ